MPPPPDPIAEARRRIAEEVERHTGTLDLGGLGLPLLPAELAALSHLQRLNIGAWSMDDEFRDPWNEAGSALADLCLLSSLRHLQSLDCSGTQVSDLGPLQHLTGLQSLDCSGTQVSDLGPLQHLTGLQSLDCSRTQVSDLGPLQHLTGLQSLTCWVTQVSDLGPLQHLTGLQSLDCSRTQVSDLGPLQHLTGLLSLTCSRTQVSDLGPLQHLTGLQSLTCWGTQVSDLGPLQHLTGLQSLDCSNTQVSDLGPLQHLTGLQSLDCSRTQVSDLGPLQHLTGLQSLDCSRTQVSDLGPLQHLTGLQSLTCWGTQVSDLGPLQHLTGLQSLTCWGTQVSDLGPLQHLTGLQSLDCSNTQVSDLGPLQHLTGLQSLDCSRTQVSDLGPLQHLTGLLSLNCSGTQVSDLGPLQHLTGLQSLDCSRTQVSDLGPLQHLTGLLSLNCSGTQVRSLAPVEKLPRLQAIYANGCSLPDVQSRFWMKKSLGKIILNNAQVPDVPAELLSKNDYSDNCLPRIRAHLADLAAGREVVLDVKLLVLGNGRAGKTQLVRRLRGPGFPYQPDWDSTHGVQVASATLPGSDGDAVPIRLHIWDFGGQDIYHGTHALFTRTRAVAAVAWATDTEQQRDYERDGITFRAHPLRYWISYARHQGSAANPLLIVQSKCDTIAEEVRRPRYDDADVAGLPYVQELRYSARTNRGRAALDDALREAAAAVHGGAPPVIGAGRLRVQRRLEAMRDADVGRPPDQKLHRTITKETFLALCAEEQGVSDPDLLLDYLHHCGVVFHRPGLFNDDIILDQQWALDAIYAVFQRQKSYRHLRFTQGRFTRPLLGDLVWNGYGVAEQRLFLSMMQQCGMCFVHRGERGGDGDDTEYIAPDLLPDRAAVQRDLDEKWDAAAPVDVATFRYTFTHPTLMRALISRIGTDARINALYWQGGVCLYEATTRSRALLEYATGDDWQGALTLRTQGGQAGELLRRLSRWVDEEQSRLGLSPVEAPPRHERSAAISLPAAKPDAVPAAQEPLLTFVQPPVAKPEWFVSYAWGDKSIEGQRREAVVDQLCARFKEKSLSIVRDKNVLRMGDSITRFMERIGQGDRVFVILSEKYLQSPHCMFELFEIWRTSEQDLDIFLSRIVPFVLEDAQIQSPIDQIRRGRYWKEQCEALKAEMTADIDVVGATITRQYQLMSRFYRDVAEILGVIADTVQPRTLDQLVEFGLAASSKPRPQEISPS